MPLRVTGGTLVTPSGTLRADLRATNGRISAIVSPGTLPPPTRGETVLDATGCHVLPGGVDPHVHAYLPLALTDAKTDYPDCSRAALLGGTTTFLDFAGSGAEPSVSDAYTLWEHHANDLVAYDNFTPRLSNRGKTIRFVTRTACDYAWHATVTHFDAAVRRDLESRLFRGLRSLKIYLAYKPALAISDPDLLATLEFAAANGLVVVAHCENPELVPYLQNRLFAAGRTSPDAHGPSRPPYVEAEGVARFLSFAAATRAKAYIAHVSSAAALDMADRYRDRLDFLRLETMPHYLLLDESYTARPDFEGAKWVLSPPLRTPADSEALWQALADGRIDTLATDHCPFDFEGQKTLGRNDFRRIPNGISGIQERLPLALFHGVAAGRISLDRLAAVAAQNPADIFGLPQKGRLAVGADADFAVWDLSSRQTLSVATQSIPTDYNPYESFPAVAPPRFVALRGQVVVRDGRLLDAPPSGRLL